MSEAEFSHEVYGEGFYEFIVKVMRLSGQADYLPVTVSERIMTEGMGVGSYICALGQFRSYNKIEDGKSRLMLTVFVREILDSQPAKNPNSIVLSGYICKPPVYRTTPLLQQVGLYPRHSLGQKRPLRAQFAGGRQGCALRQNSKPRIPEKTAGRQFYNHDCIRSFGFETRRLRRRFGVRYRRRIRSVFNAPRIFKQRLTVTLSKRLLSRVRGIFLL